MRTAPPKQLPKARAQISGWMSRPVACQRGTATRNKVRDADNAADAAEGARRGEGEGEEPDLIVLCWGYYTVTFCCSRVPYAVALDLF